MLGTLYGRAGCPMRPYSLLSTIFLAVLDCLFCWLSWAGSVFVFTYLFVVDNSLINSVNRNIWVMVAACAVFYTACGVHKSLWRHPGIGSALRLAAAVFLVSFAVYVSLRLQLGYWVNPGLGMMSFYFLLTFSLIVRLYRKISETVFHYSRRFMKLPDSLPQEPIRALLVGAGESASAFLLHKSQQGTRPREIRCIVDNDGRKHGYSLHGVVFSTRERQKNAVNPRGNIPSQGRIVLPWDYITNSFKRQQHGL